MTISNTFKNFYNERKARKKVHLSRSAGGTFLIFLFLFLVGCFMALPLVYTVVQAFKPINEIYAYPPKFFVRNPTLDNFYQVYELANNLWVPFSRYILNSVFLSVAGTLLYVIIASLAAFPLAKINFPGRGLFSLLIVLMILFRTEVTDIPRYVIIAKMGIVNTYWAVLLPALSGSFGVFLMKQFIVSSIPDSILEAGRLDGASEGMIFRKIVIPCVRPAWLTLVIFTFQGLWNTTGTNYIYSENLKMLPSVLSTIAAGGIARAGAASAVSLILIIPPIVIFIISQSSVMETMSQSGLK